MDKNEFKKKVLAIHAHPDDTEAFCAGTLKMLKDIGYEVTIATMTAGGLGGINIDEELTMQTREKEARLAAEALGAGYFCLGERDGFVFDNTESRMKVIQLIRQETPGIIITHLPVDYHCDHRTTCLIVEASAMLSTLANLKTEAPVLANRPLLYHTSTLTLSDPLGTPIGKPHFYIDITSSMEAKTVMLEKHESQRELMKHMHGMDNYFEIMKEYNAELGERVGAKYAEAFWQHIGGGFPKDRLIQDELEDFVVYQTLEPMMPK